MHSPVIRSPFYGTRTLAIRNTGHDGPPAFQTSPECNSEKILRMPNQHADREADRKISRSLRRYAYARSRTREKSCFLLITPAMMVRPLSKPPPSATARKSCGCQTSTPTVRRIEKSLAVSGDMRMLGRERERNRVSYLSYFCTLVLRFWIKIALECIILEFSSRYGNLLEHRGSDGPAIMYSNTIKFQLYTADSALAVDHDVAEPALW